MALIILLLKPLFLTILIELFVAVCYKIRNFRDLSIILIAQVLTNPLINIGMLFVLFFENIVYYGLYLFFGELMVLYCEAFIYKKFLKTKKKLGYKLAYMGNISSFGVGIIYMFIRSLY